MSTGVRLRDRIIAMMVRGTHERFELPRHLTPALERMLEAVLGTRDAMEEVANVLRLAIALETTLESPSAGRMLRDLLRSDRRALLLIRARFVDEKGIDEARRFQRSEGRAPAVGAPKLERAQSGGLRAADFLTPAGDRRPRRGQSASVPRR